MKKHLLIFLLTLSFSANYAQVSHRPFEKELIIGGIIPLGNEISSVFNQGLSAEFRVSKSFKDFIFIKPFFNYSFFANHPNSSQLESIHFLTFGINLDLTLKIKSNTKIYIGPSIFANHYFDYLDWADKNILDYKENNIVMNGNLFSYDLRMGLNVKKFIFELCYKPFKSDPHFKKAYFNSLRKDKLYELYQVNYKRFDLTMFSINMGLKL